MKTLPHDMRNYIVQEFLDGEDSADLTPEFDLIDNGVVDSLGLVRVISHISRTYAIPVDDIPIAPDNFRTITAICAFIDNARSETTA
ncbi:acyl carrier protein [Streptomyces sp. NA04227]|uniref:acyl carrier protein n=1 Tax=Streptomyces sp. NA04227 TaxID=2742136 RepID=UPI0015901400|nr:phosphopantetheine-binding protein [Streptomyces sp. NA04227]QKW05254.1 acyl carrier protein [Streptomyces sp. NA04227]